MSNNPCLNMKCPPDYIRTIPGILKIIEMPLAIIAFACSAAVSNVTFYGDGFNGTYGFYGGGWVNFVTIVAFICAAVWFILRMLNILPENVPLRIAEFVNYVLWTLLLLIAGIVAACRGWWHSNIGAAAFFTFAAMIVFGIDAGLQFPAFRLQWQNRSGGGTTTVTTTTTTTSQSTTEVDYDRSQPTY